MDKEIFQKQEKKRKEITFKLISLMGVSCNRVIIADLLAEEERAMNLQKGIFVFCLIDFPIHENLGT